MIPGKKRGKTQLIAGLALIVLLVGIVGAAMYNVRATSTPTEVVTRFYNTWIATPDPYASRLHEKSTYVTEEFGRMVVRAHEQGRDNVLCGTPTVTFTLTEPRYGDDGESASMRLETDTATVYVVLVKDDKGWWRIDETDCDAPTLLDMDAVIEQAQETLPPEFLQNG